MTYWSKRCLIVDFGSFVWLVDPGLKASSARTKYMHLPHLKFMRLIRTSSVLKLDLMKIWWQHVIDRTYIQLEPH